MKELFSTYKLPIIFGVLGLILACFMDNRRLFQDFIDLDHGRYRCRYRFLLKQTKILDHYLNLRRKHP